METPDVENRTLISGVDARSMRVANAGVMLRALYGRPDMSQAEIAAATNLSRRTVELILGELQSEGWVHETTVGLHPSGRGRPAKRFAFRADAGAVVGIVIAHDRTTAVVADLTGRAMSTAVTLVEGEPDRAGRIALTRETVQRALRDNGIGHGDVGAAAISTPGNVNDSGAVDLDLSMIGWKGVRLAEEFAGDFPCSVFVENNAKLAALAEMWEGATQGADHLLWLLLEGRYNGMAIIADGRPYRGVDGVAGEIFWADRLGLSELAESALAGLDPLQSAPQRRVAADIVAAASAGQPDALAEVDAFAAILARALSTLSWVLAPRYVVLGGTVGVAFGDLLAERVRLALGNTVPGFLDVRASSLGGEAVTRGTIKAALDRFDWTTARALPTTRTSA